MPAPMGAVRRRRTSGERMKAAKASAAKSARQAAARPDGPEKRFRILACIDGSDEGYRCLRYAARLGTGNDADIVLVYVRPSDQGLRSGGLQIRVARENMLKWGLELPGIRYLKKGRDLLEELGVMKDGDWHEETGHVDVEGDPLGDNKIVYTNDAGKQVVLKLKVASDIATGILEQWEIGLYDLIILSEAAPEQSRAGSLAKFWDPAVADKVAIHAPCSVLVARDLEEGHGHLICTDGSDRAMDMVRKDAVIASRCNCSISLISVALTEEALPHAQDSVDKAEKMLNRMGINVVRKLTPVGDPVEEIARAGRNYSVIVLSDSATTGIKRFFMGSVAFKVLEEAHHSVMIVR